MQSEDLIFSLEKGFRFIENEKTPILFYFFTTQIKIHKKHVSHNKNYEFLIYNANKELVEKKSFYLDLVNLSIKTPFSHEDPLIAFDEYYFLAFELVESQIRKLSNSNTTIILNSIQNNITEEMFRYEIENIPNIYNHHQKNNYTKINIENNTIHTNKECVLNLHLGFEDAQYSEESHPLKANSTFNYSELLNKYEYLGIQFSYENEMPEIEEKYILAGQKGIYLSGCFYHNNIKYQSNLPAIEKFQKKYSTEKFLEINSIQELINFYKKTKKKPHYFESNLFFVLPYYNKPTYNQDMIFSTNKISNKNQFNLTVCKNCSKNYKCIQIVPSGLSSLLFKENLLIEETTQCKIFNLIQN